MQWLETSEGEENPWISGPSQKVCLDLKNSRRSRKAKIITTGIHLSISRIII